MECPDCEGKGNVPRTDAVDGLGYLKQFPKLCDRCSGSGEVKPPKPPKEG
jgi:DnaJ-class molecular chaperone